jgi:hypothetical protein
MKLAEGKKDKQAEECVKLVLRKVYYNDVE